MEETRRRQKRVDRHARRFAQETLDGAGSRTDVARALGRDPSTISHEVRTRCNPVLYRAFVMILTLAAAASTSVRVFVDAVNEAVELHDILRADTTTLEARGFYLLEHINVLVGLVHMAAIRSTESHAAALRTLNSAAGELAAIADELRFRGRDLLVLYRQTQGATS